jgi:hypothetical protein
MSWERSRTLATCDRALPARLTGRCWITPEAIAPPSWLLPSTSSAGAGRGADVRRREHRRGAASTPCCFDEPRRWAGRLLEARPSGPSKYFALPRPPLLRLAERHRGPGGVRLEVHRLVDRHGDAAVRRARRDRWLSSNSSARRTPASAPAHRSPGSCRLPKSGPCRVRSEAAQIDGVPATTARCRSGRVANSSQFESIESCASSPIPALCCRGGPRLARSWEPGQAAANARTGGSASAWSMRIGSRRVLCRSDVATAAKP